MVKLALKTETSPKAISSMPSQVKTRPSSPASAAEKASGRRGTEAATTSLAAGAAARSASTSTWRGVISSAVGGPVAGVWKGGPATRGLRSRWRGRDWHQPPQARARTGSAGTYPQVRSAAAPSAHPPPSSACAPRSGSLRPSGDTMFGGALLNQLLRPLSSFGDLEPASALAFHPIDPVLAIGGRLAGPRQALLLPRKRAQGRGGGTGIEEFGKRRRKRG